MPASSIEIQWQCEQLLRRATQCMDNADWPAYVDCFTRDAILSRPSDPDNPMVGREQILASLQARPPRLTCHLLANAVFDVISDNEVQATSRVLLLSGDISISLPAPAHKKLLAGTFKDRLVNLNGTWKIAARQGSIELALDLTLGDV